MKKRHKVGGLRLHKAWIAGIRAPEIFTPLDHVFFGGSELAFRNRSNGCGPEGSNIFAGRPLSGATSRENRDHTARFTQWRSSPHPKPFEIFPPEPPFQLTRWTSKGLSRRPLRIISTYQPQGM
jgi:hypothetical protein